MPAGDTLRPDLASRDPSPPPAIYDRVERDAKFGKQQADLVQVHNECDVTQTSPDELPDIDIHSL
jgi:ribose 1,5-bisphosphokinase PhnN